MTEPATEAGRALLDAMFTDEGGMPVDPGAAILAIEQEAAAIERRKTVEQLADALPKALGKRGWSLGLSEGTSWQAVARAILDELSPPSSDRGA